MVGKNDPAWCNHCEILVETVHKCSYHLSDRILLQTVKLSTLDPLRTINLVILQKFWWSRVCKGWNFTAISGSIQEDWHKVEHFHFLWNTSTICGTASQNCGTAPQKVEQVLKAGHCLTNCGTVPQKVAQLLLNVACYFKMWNSVPLLTAYHIVVDRHTHHYFG